MKKIFKISFLPALIALIFTTSCSDFEEINVNPLKANESQVQVEYFINNSIIGAQMDPHIAERVFVLYWKTAGHQQMGGGISTGGYADDWSSDYYGSGYMGGWLNHIYAAIEVAEKQIESGDALPYTNNLLQVARIWRAYLLSELADAFGPIPVDGYQGVNPTFSDLATVYNFLLTELADATSKMDPSVTGSLKAELDRTYGFNYDKWQRYGNSLRLRLAMRLSEVDPGTAKTHFEAAASQPLMTSLDGTFEVQETGGWDALTGVMTRVWNYFNISATMDNALVGLGGIKSADLVGAELQGAVKEEGYAGLKLTDHFTTMTNDPKAGFWLDGLPYSIDPRAYKMYIIPGDGNNPDSPYGSDDIIRSLVDDDGNVVLDLNAKHTWNGVANGDWGKKGSKNQMYSFSAATPQHGMQFRDGTNQRVYFGPWETYFLLAEGAVRGSSTPMSAQAAYEAGIDASFAYWDSKTRSGVMPSSFLADYKTSTSYNRLGTSVAWNHTEEPPASYEISYIDGYTGEAGTTTRIYPENDLYKGGSVKNDQLTKIITQKFIAQSPWVPLETWNDHRRLGLPFFENPAVENPMANMPGLNSGNYMTSKVEFFPQRLRYPSGLANSNPAGYGQAVSALGGADEVLTPLWWAQK